MCKQFHQPQEAIELITPWKAIVIVNDAMSGRLKYGYNVGCCNIFLQYIGEQSRLDGNNADSQTATWITE